jgi:hypothetical protein
MRSNHVPRPCSKKSLEPPPPDGPGYYLKKTLAWWGVESNPDCLCNKRAEVMDRKGPDWCEKNLDKIVEWLREEHVRRKLVVPFVAPIVRRVVMRAIEKSRKARAKT